MTSKYQTRPRPPKGPSTNGQSTQQRRNAKAATVDDTSDIQIRYFSFIIYVKEKKIKH